MDIKTIVDEYNKNIDFMSEHKISNETMANAEKFESMLKAANITGYDLVPSSTGEFYFDWDTEKLSFGVGIKGHVATLEYLNKQVDNDSYVEAYDFKNQEDVDELINILDEIVNGI